MVFKLDYGEYYSLLNDIGETPSLNSFSFSSVVVALVCLFQNNRFPVKEGKTRRFFFPSFLNFEVKLSLPDEKEMSKSSVDLALRSFLSLPAGERLDILSKIH